MRVSDLLKILETTASRDDIRIIRQPENYQRFLELYQRVGYAPNDAQARRSWRDRTVRTWQLLDNEILPGSCGGGANPDGDIVSSWGTLPLCSNVVYGHSVCMDRTLWGICTLYLLGLYSLQWADRVPGVAYWAGAYPYRSGFTARFQRPSFDIPGQFIIDVVKFLPAAPVPAGKSTPLDLRPFSESDLRSIPKSGRALFTLLRYVHPAMSGVHKVTTYTAHARNGKVSAVVLDSESQPELTAANVLSRTWVFPVMEATVFTELAGTVRTLLQIPEKVIQVVMAPESIALFPDSDTAVPGFWAFCPKQSLDTLKSSFASAFEQTIKKYSDREIEMLAASLLA